MSGAKLDKVLDGAFKFLTKKSMSQISSCIIMGRRCNFNKRDLQSEEFGCSSLNIFN